MSSQDLHYDIVVVGGGGSGLAAAIEAARAGARVVVLEKAPRDMRGGNTHWAGAVLRIAFDDPHELAPLLSQNRCVPHALMTGHAIINVGGERLSVRATLLVSRPARLRLTDWLPGRPDRPDQKLNRPVIIQRLPLAEVTIAEALQPAGYRRYAVGKWHVTPGQSAKALADQHNWPLQRGFDRYYGTIHGAGSYWDPSALVRDNQQITTANDPEYRPKRFYYTDAISDQAVRFIREHARDHGAKPFFLYVAYTAAHWPMHAKESDIAKYRGRYDAGYAAIRDARWARQKQLGLVDSKWTPAPLAGDWDKVKNREFETRCMEVYAAMVDCMDQGIGRVVGELKQQGLFDNTLILYLQDNGGCAETVGRGMDATVRAERPALPVLAPDEFQFNSRPKQTRDGWPVRTGYGVLPGPADTYVSYGREWANVSNTPFREYKHWVHEGGIATPLIAHWPKGIPESQRNQLAQAPGQLVDLMATCLDVAGAKYPAEFRGQKITPLEGVSLRPAFAGKPLPRAQPLVWEHEGNRAIREGDWKLVAKGPKGAWELYNLAADRPEMNDLASQQPERVEALAAKWDAWAKRAHVLP